MKSVPWSNYPQGEGRGVLSFEVLYKEAPSRDPNPYPFIMPFLFEKVPLSC